MSAESIESKQLSDEEKLQAQRVGALMYKHDKAAHLLGIQLEMIAPGFAKMSMKVRSDMLNGHGILHGGMTFSLADTAFAYACNSKNHKTVALACHITYVVPGRDGDVLVAIAEEQAASGKTGVYDIKIANQNGTVVALFRGNSYRTGQPVLVD